MKMEAEKNPPSKANKLNIAPLPLPPPLKKQQNTTTHLIGNHKLTTLLTLISLKWETRGEKLKCYFSNPYKDNLLMCDVDKITKF